MISLRHAGPLTPLTAHARPPTPLHLHTRVKPEGAAFEGTGSGEVSFTVVSPPARGERRERRSTVTATLTAPIIPTPPR